VEEEILPGDLDTGDVIMLTGDGDELLVKAVRLGQDGFILTVSPAGDDTPGTERFITLTAATHLRRRRCDVPSLAGNSRRV
jgi:hypothetical protein